MEGCDARGERGVDEERVEASRLLSAYSTPAAVVDLSAQGRDGATSVAFPRMDDTAWVPIHGNRRYGHACKDGIDLGLSTYIQYIFAVVANCFTNWQGTQRATPWLSLLRRVRNEPSMADNVANQCVHDIQYFSV